MYSIIQKYTLSFLVGFSALIFIVIPLRIAFAIEPALEFEWQGEDIRGEFGFTVSTDGDTVVVGAPFAWSNGFYSGSVYIYLREENGNWSEPIRWVGGSAYEYFGWSVSVSADTLVIGAPYDGISGSAYVYVRGENGNWGAPIKWVGESSGDMFGWSVSINGDTVVIGAPEVNANGANSGAAYVFVRDEDRHWSDPVKWVGRTEFDGFGRSVSVDKDLIVIGAPWADNNGSGSGAAYVYVRDGPGWDEPIEWSGAGPGSYFGWSVSVDGDAVVIGAAGESSNGVESGSVYIYKRDGRGWSSRVVLTGEIAKDGFGGSVSVSGNTLVVGAPGSDVNGDQSGSAYIFELDGCGNWRRQTRLTGHTANDHFGYSVALSSDGNRMVVGATSRNEYDPGRIRLYDSSIYNYFRINSGLNDAWYYPVTDGQGFFITIFHNLCKATLAWFTYDTELPPSDAIAYLGDPGHRWLTAIGPVDGDHAILSIVLTSGGIFDTPTEIQRTDPPGSDGYLTLTFDSCNSGTVEYDIPSVNLHGIVPIQRVADDNIVICEALK